jgi:hypothetical protein
VCVHMCWDTHSPVKTTTPPGSGLASGLEACRMQHPEKTTECILACTEPIVHKTPPPTSKAHTTMPDTTTQQVRNTHSEGLSHHTV